MDGEKLTELELATFFVLLMSAGNDSTRATYSATMLEMLRNPELRAQLREHPELIDAAVEEGTALLSRRSRSWRAPRPKTPRLHGKTIKENDRVLLWYLASNRDESVVSESGQVRHHPGRVLPTSIRRSAAAASTSASAPTSRVSN